MDSKKQLIKKKTFVFFLLIIISVIQIFAIIGYYVRYSSRYQYSDS